MKTAKLDKMTKGWFVGDFEPNITRTKDCEVAYRKFLKGATEQKHVHKIATEITVIVSGRAKMNGATYQAGDIIALQPGEASDFEGLEDGTLIVVKYPSVPGDKYAA